MVLKVGLVDDNIMDLKKLEAIVKEITPLKIVFSTTCSNEAHKNILESTVDLLIADIEMPNFSGYQLANIIATHALDITVIFVTASSGYAVHAFELNVHDYIMKPYTKERLIQSIDKLLHKKQSSKISGHLYIKQKSEIHIIPKKTIVFIERTGRSTTIYTKNGAIKTYQTLNELEGKLLESDFLRSHRSCIINIHYIQNFTLYAKNSYIVSFDCIEEKAYITKESLKYLQGNYF